MQRSTIDLWVGLFVMAGVGALLVLAMKVGNMSGASVSETYQLTAQFDNIGGLKSRAPVKSAGVVVGRVAAIQFDNEKFVARVTLNIDKSYKFPKDTSASIMTSGLLGEQYIGLEGGGDPANLNSGDRIKQTQSAVVLEKLIGQFLYSKAAEGGDKK
ncbi:MAG TPA: outer membrane lipid asymmetry maintenance protein MlaD [Burkholderiales bacterium]|nr:outer membrane lipid asymmetry maintenance protein MlaD [Burkholderiales bacterium]